MRDEADVGLHGSAGVLPAELHALCLKPKRHEPVENRFCCRPEETDGSSSVCCPFLHEEVVEAEAVCQCDESLHTGKRETSHAFIAQQTACKTISRRSGAWNGRRGQMIIHENKGMTVYLHELLRKVERMIRIR
jgi:hypothetical protein